MADLQPALERIDQIVRQRMEEDEVPGAALAITDRERTLHVATYGYANLDSREPVRPEHLFQTGSIGKTFTAIALLQLHQEGRLDLRAPVTDYLPWFEVKTSYEPITVHHLLTHRAGIVGVNDVLTDKFFDVWALRRLEPAWAPGSRYYYSNVGYKTLSLVLERIEGSGYGEIIRRRILDPLGLTHSEPVITQEIRSRLATGYEYFYDDRPWLPRHGHAPAIWLEISTGDGAMAMPVTELAAFLRALMNRDRALLPAEGFDLLTTRFSEVEPDHWYGYGLDIDEMDGHTMISHGGEMPGYWSSMFADLDTGFGVAVMINHTNQIFSTIPLMLRTLSAAASGTPLPDVPEPVDRMLVENAAEYAGTYYALPGGEEAFKLVAENPRLSMSVGGMKVPVWKLDEDSFVADHPDFCRLPLRFGEGSEAGRRVRHGGSEYLGGMDRRPDSAIVTPPPRPDDERGGLAGHYRTHGSTFSNFRIVATWDGALLFAHPSGLEWTLHQIDESTWRVDDTPETVRFDAFIDGKASRASFSGCDYYRTFTE